MSKAEAKRTVDLVLGEVEAGLKKSKKEGPQSTDGRSDPDQGLQGSEVPAGCHAEKVCGHPIPG